MKRQKCKKNHSLKNRVETKHNFIAQIHGNKQTENLRDERI